LNNHASTYVSSQPSKKKMKSTVMWNDQWGCDILCHCKTLGSCDVKISICTTLDENLYNHPYGALSLLWNKMNFKVQEAKRLLEVHQLVVDKG
jgi:hypothetical protein